MDPIPCDQAFLNFIAESNQTFVDTNSNENHTKSGTYILPEMQNIEFFEPPRQFYEVRRPSLFHPLCCFLKASYFLNGENKTELFYSLQNLSDANDSGLNPLRMALARFRPSSGPVWDPVTKQMVHRESLSHEDYKRAVNVLLNVKCDFWNHTKDKVNKAFDDAKTQCLQRTSAKTSLLKELLFTDKNVSRTSPISALQNLVISID